VKPIPGLKERSSLIVVPDGKLHLLPFDSLQDAQGRLVLESHVVTNSPSATVFHLLRTSSGRKPSTMSLLGVGAVPYESKPETLLSQNQGQATGKGTVARGLFDLEGAKLQDLPGTRQELASAGQIIGKNSVLLMGEKATEAAFKSQPLADFKILHMAVHGIAQTDFPERAALVLGRDPNSQEDGLLQGREISSLRLNAELAILSACDTAVGRLQGQEGIANLVQSFFLAGARTVVASLWNADDEFTIGLMKRFYENLASGKDRGSALRLAKLDLLKRYSHSAPPLRWAGFIMAGEGARSFTIGPPTLPPNWF
jgi:CHAT domain-containing protein